MNYFVKREYFCFDACRTGYGVSFRPPRLGLETSCLALKRISGRLSTPSSNVWSNSEGVALV